MNRVLISCPMSERICRGATPDSDNINYFTGIEWLKHIDNQTYPDFDVYININDVSINTLQEIMNCIKDMQHMVYYDVITTGYPTDTRGTLKRRADVSREHGQKPYEHFAKMRNIVLDWFLVHNYSHLVSIDSDVMTHPDAVVVMISHIENEPNLGMVGLPVNNSRMRMKKHREGLYHGTAQYNFGTVILHDKHSIENTVYRSIRSFDNSVLSVDFTGACIVMNGSMLRNNPEIRYGPHRQGEDCYFCYKIKEAGYNIHILTNHTTLHMQDPFIVPLDQESFKNREII